MTLEAAVYSSSPPQMGLIVAITGIKRTGNRNAYDCWPDHEDARVVISPAEAKQEEAPTLIGGGA